VEKRSVTLPKNYYKIGSSSLIFLQKELKIKPKDFKQHYYFKTTSIASTVFKTETHDVKEKKLLNSPKN